MKLTINVFKKKFQHVLDVDGRIKVNKYFQVEGCEKIFAIGDCCNMENNKMAIYAYRHGDHVGKNIQLISQNQKPVEYVPQIQPAMIMTLGRTGGVTLFSSGIYGNFFTGMLKGRDLFTRKTWSDLNQKQGFPVAKTKSIVKDKNLASAMGMSSDETSAFVSSIRINNQEKDKNLASAMGMSSDEISAFVSSIRINKQDNY